LLSLHPWSCLCVRGREGRGREGEREGRERGSVSKRSDKYRADEDTVTLEHSSGSLLLNRP
jgi:hypothetical protein